MRKRRRHAARIAKHARISPRPTDGPLRPIVRCQTNKYNMHVRIGRGFSLEELKEAGVAAKYAPTIGIAVDARRKNRSLDAMQENVQRIKEYMTRVVVFPRKGGLGEGVVVGQVKGALMPIEKKVAEVEVRKITDEDLKKTAYRSLRIERVNKRMHGLRRKRELEKASAAVEKSKK